MKSIQLGITGGIGSGKTVVCRVLTALNIPVFDADSEAKILLENDAGVIEGIQHIFGKEAYGSSGKANRQFISAIAFDNPDKLKQLNELVHPGVQNAYRQWAKSQSDSWVVVKEAAIMFESGSYKDMDYVAAVLAPVELRINRVINRDERSETAIRSIMQKQLTDEELIKKADFIIVNDDKHLVTVQVLELLSKLKNT